MNPEVDLFFVDGCGRCPLGGTPDCKVHNWTEELRQLRRILLECGLTEELKWSVPCYTFENNNILILSAFNDFCSLSFFKGALLKDTENLLEKPGPNTQAARLIKFKDVETINELEPVLKAYVKEAIEIEKAGLKITFEKRPEPIPEELEEQFANDPSFESAFFALTPGRQRGYILYFSQPKQSKTRVSRIEKSKANIFEGKGMQER